MTNALRVAAAVYGVTFVVHLADHLRRGTDASPRAVIVVGSIAAVIQALAIVAVLLRHRHSGLIAVAVGMPDALGIVAVHLLPAWGPLSDSYPSGAPGVTWFSWTTAIAQAVAAAAFAAAGWAALRRSPAPAA